MYEHRSHRPLSQRQFLARLLRHGGIAAAMVAASLAIGMAGYVRFEHLGWLDAFLNSAMLLGGMGPVDLPRTPAGKARKLASMLCRKAPYSGSGR